MKAIRHAGATVEWWFWMMEHITKSLLASTWYFALSWALARSHARMHAHTDVHTHTHTHMYARTHTHAHTHFWSVWSECLINNVKEANSRAINRATQDIQCKQMGNINTNGLWGTQLREHDTLLSTRNTLCFLITCANISLWKWICPNTKHPIRSGTRSPADNVLPVLAHSPRHSIYNAYQRMTSHKEWWLLGNYPTQTYVLYIYHVLAACY